MGYFIQQSFVGGLNKLVDPTRIQRNEYPFLMNGRTRFDLVQPIRRAKAITDGLVVNDKIQGMFSYGSICLVFMGGRVYYKDYNGSADYKVIDNLQLSNEVDVLHAELVPASTVNGIRKLAQVYTNGGINFFTSGMISSTPQVLLVQDGINQPWIIFADGTARQTQTYEEWQRDGVREYVPIGRQMLYTAGKLFIVSSDGTRIYHSVTGRPLDFMVVVDQDGNKLSFDQGAADNVAHRVDYAQITAIHSLNSPDGGFIVCTGRASYTVALNFNNTIYGEPTFNNTFLFDTGAVNNDSIIDINGDTAFVDYYGIRSFNAVQQYRFEGRNAPFSAKIQALFKDVFQFNSAAYVFDNYALFSVNSTYGPIVVVYDTINKTYSAIDRYQDITGNILQFVAVKTFAEYKLFCYTSNNQIFQLFKGDELETCSVFIGEFCSNDPSIEQKPMKLRAVFVNVQQKGQVAITPYMDREKDQVFTPFVQCDLVNDSRDLPFYTLGDASKIAVIDLTKQSNCWKIGALLQWNFLADLSHLSILCDDYKAASSNDQTLSDSNEYGSGVVFIKAFTPTTSEPNGLVTISGIHFLGVVGIKIGSTVISNFTIVNDTTIEFTIPAGTKSANIILITDDYQVTSNDVLTIL